MLRIGERTVKFHVSALMRKLGLATAPLPWADYLHAHGFPIRYEYMEQSWPLAYCQTAFAVEPGSAEMPSAGRPFTPELIIRLEANGVQMPRASHLQMLQALAGNEHLGRAYEEALAAG